MNDDELNQESSAECYRSFQAGSDYVPNNEQLLEAGAIESEENHGNQSECWSEEASSDSEPGHEDGQTEEIEDMQETSPHENEESEPEDKPSESASESDDDTPLAARQSKNTNSLSCKDCRFKTSDLEALVKHQSKHEDFLELCIVCDIQFKLEWEWLSHLRERHASALWLGPGEANTKRNRGRHKKPTPTKFVCSKCNYKAYSKRAIRDHIFKVHGKSKLLTKILSSRPVICGKCDYKAPSEFHLKKHINLVHMNEVKPKHILCEMCGAKMQSRKSYENHLESIHRIYESGKPTEYLCDQCPYKVKSRGALYSHVRDKHRKGIVQEHKCPQCDFSSTRKSNIKNHMFTKHTDESTLPKYKCPICDYQTKYKNVIPTHIRKIHRRDEQPLHHCSLCDFSTIHPYNLKKHQLVHKDREEVKIYKCPHCKYETRHKHGVATHMLVHTPAEQTTMYRCDLCNFQTKYKFGLQQHMRSSLHKNNSSKCGDSGSSLTLDWAKAEHKATW